MAFTEHEIEFKTVSVFQNSLCSVNLITLKIKNGNLHHTAETINNTHI